MKLKEVERGTENGARPRRKGSVSGGEIIRWQHKCRSLVERSLDCVAYPVTLIVDKSTQNG